MTANSRTRVAVLGTLAEFHQEPIPYDISALLVLVAKINPDLLCLDMTLEQWQERDFSHLPQEYQEALLLLAQQTDIVVAPIGGRRPQDRPQVGGWRGTAITLLRQRIASIQRRASNPDAINQGWRHDVANYLYAATRWLSGREVKREADYLADHLTHGVLAVSRRDPAARLLVVVNVQYCHIIRERLRRYENLEVTAYSTL